MIRLGIVDFDSSHSLEYTRRFNHVGVDAGQRVEGARVVMGWPGTSEMGPERIPGFARGIEECGVELVDAPEAMIGRIDAVLVLSLCGAAHLERVRPFVEAGVPAYVDKPFACSLADADEMLRLSQEHGVLLFSGSAMRFCGEVLDFRQRERELGRLHGMVSYGPAKRAEGNPGLFHYGIHTVEILLEMMGSGCRELSATYTEEADLLTARWEDGRVATLRGNRAGATAYGFVGFCENGVIHSAVSTRYAYRNLCRRLVTAFETGEPAVPLSASREVVAFVEAALQSEQSGGDFVPLATSD